MRRGTGSGDLFATAGFYWCARSVLAEAEAARADGLTALRLFLERLLARGYRVAAIRWRTALTSIGRRTSPRPKRS